jgi:hypothetical protein
MQAMRRHMQTVNEITGNNQQEFITPQGTGSSVFYSYPFQIDSFIYLSNDSF